MVNPVGFGFQRGLADEGDFEVGLLGDFAFALYFPADDFVDSVLAGGLNGLFVGLVDLF